ncbi:MAG TPA: phosphoethanolamine--lipid A transferase [Holophaga sp.]|nr:phosphoethanolamine--lipid A transferase [Holophaga sp.]HPS68006.1 phosphoethanolamine--lipid A transferase [Holophaga sp.]
MPKKPTLRSRSLILALAGLLCTACSFAFWKQLVSLYPATFGNLGFLASVAACYLALTALLLTLFDFPYLFKPAAIALVLGASVAAYFMDAYHVVIDPQMLANALQTDRGEVRDLMNLRFFAYLAGGLLLSAGVAVTRITRSPFPRAHLASLAKRAAVLVAVVAVALVPCNRAWASFLREHKAVRQYANPAFPIYSVAKLAGSQLSGPAAPLERIGEDARIPAAGRERDLVIMVVGEAARPDHFSLNGYPRQTNPRLSGLDVVSFTRMVANGTSTANSVPCMFSTLDYRTFSARKARSTENLLDVLQRAGVHVLWRDNNSDSKGVAARVAYEDFKAEDRNPAVEGEPRDVGMLAGLQAYIDQQKTGSIFIVLHQMGNHGPAYYKRYPSAFEKFKPVARTNELGSSSPQEIINAYDNALLCTDDFLARVIQLLQKNSGRFRSAMIYSSDHGESLGENGLYLHGMPYRFAPEEQKRVATLFWFSKGLESEAARFRKARNLPLSHSVLFHTVLGLLGVQTKVYDPGLDIAKLAP